MDRGEFALALSTVDSFLGQNPRNSEATRTPDTAIKSVFIIVARMCSENVAMSIAETNWIICRKMF